uniref:Aminodeoxychorismate synthase component 2 n=1 Tax=Streptomyces lividans TaxID=1916 RepID=PABA_STRLI|nr:RecName: Full=Aminodeoxychorismate synthase component 2; Short=ADC synthase; Short=ADCS; AltName: Full=4-amino-4-deoxychorismate synthase component 2; AltName: Full=Aminodeoxychorismate synthase, glutamine amidotransferase component [Streptomyces lividans]AAA26799.1 putative [Streptomyces lividans]
MTSVLMIDNCDSFTYNLVDQFSPHGTIVIVKRNHPFYDGEIEAIMALTSICITPGPCYPAEAALNSCSIIGHLAGRIPILGICLGQQALGQARGGLVIFAHGKLSNIEHNGIFAPLFNPPRALPAGRYHSLVVEPARIEVTGQCNQLEVVPQEIMAIRHRDLPVEGVQFHPESILSSNGAAILANLIHRPCH